MNSQTSSTQNSTTQTARRTAAFAELDTHFPTPHSCEREVVSAVELSPQDLRAAVPLVACVDAPVAQISSAENFSKNSAAFSIHESQLATRALVKSYPMGSHRVQVLRGVDFAVRAGEFLSIVGQSGSGKSTLLHLLGTLDVPDSGSIHFDGARIDNLSTAQRDLLRNRFIGFIFQFYHLLPELTALENVLSPLMIRDNALRYFWNRRAYQNRAKELLGRVGLLHRLHHKPNELSGGEMQRVSIARALITSPKILLADEPTGNLDTHASAEILALLREFNHQTGLTVVMVTHDLALARSADRLVRIADGVMV